jgi:hypothetical protein
MHHEGQEIPPRKLVFIERPSFARLACSECAWVFFPSEPPVGNSLDEITRNLQGQLSQQFAAHVCAEHPRVNEATA